MSIHGWLISSKWERLLIFVIVVNLVLFNRLKLLREGLIRSRRLFIYQERISTHVYRVRILLFFRLLLLPQSYCTLQFSIVKVRMLLLLDQFHSTALFGLRLFNGFWWWFFIFGSFRYTLKGILTSAIEAWKGVSWDEFLFIDTLELTEVTQERV